MGISPIVAKKPRKKIGGEQPALRVRDQQTPATPVGALTLLIKKTLALEACLEGQS